MTQTHTARRRLQILSLLWVIGLAGLTGCQSVQSTRLLEDAEIGTPMVEEVGESGTFLEVVRPQPAWILEDQARRLAWTSDDYREDIARGFQAFEVPTTYRLTLEEFLADPAQAANASPYIDVQVRQRTKITAKKRHQVISKATFSQTATTTVEELPVWSWWRWEPEQGIAGQGETASVVAVDLLTSKGVFSTQSGTLGPDGAIRISLSPFFEHVVGGSKGLNLRVTCQTLGLSVMVEVEPQVILHYHKNLHQKAGAQAWDSVTP